MFLNRRAAASPAGGNTPRWKVVTFYLLVGLAFCGLAVLVQFVASKVVEGETADHAKAVNDARISLIQLLGGTGLLGGFIYTVRTFGLTRDTQRSDRFTKAISQLGDKDSESIRAGGVYSLRLLTLEDRRYWPVVEQILCGMVRERAKPGGPVTGDVQAALTVIGERPDRETLGRRPLDLRHVYLPEAHLVGANLEGVWMDHACLAGADLTDARLTNSNLTNINLEKATLSSADFTAADLAGANLREANFYRTTITSADLSGSDRTGAVNLEATADS